MEELKKTIGLISGGGTTNLEVLLSEERGGELYGLTQTIAIISSNSKARGIEKALSCGFPKKDIHILDPKNVNFTTRLLEIFAEYDPHFYHQLGWMPLTPEELIMFYRGLNQHLGPGGRYMHGRRRIWVHIEFCKLIGRPLPIPVFCQLVHPEFDKGDIVCMEEIEVDLGQDIQAIADLLLPIEHQVQIKGRKMFATGDYILKPVPEYARTPDEAAVLDRLKLESRKVFPNG